jgi:hypothetical protein
MADGERGTHRQNREDGKRPLPISPAAFQVAELRQLGVANIRHLPLDHPALTVRAEFGARVSRSRLHASSTQSR